MNHVKKLLLLAALVVSMASSAVAQSQIQTTRIVINQPTSPSGAGWSKITRAWLLNGQNMTIGVNAWGLRQFEMVGGRASQIWLTDSAGYGSLHTLDVSGTYDRISIDVQGPVIASGVRPFFYQTTKGSVQQSSPITYLTHAKVPFPQSLQTAPAQVPNDKH